MVEGGSSDVAVKLLGCVRVQLSRGRRKRGIKRGAERPRRGGERGRTVSPKTRRVLPRTPRTDTQTPRHGGLRGGRLQREIIMERQAGGRLLWLDEQRIAVPLLCYFPHFIYFKSNAGSCEVSLKDLLLLFFSRACFLLVVSASFQWSQVYQTGAG